MIKNMNNKLLSQLQNNKGTLSSALGKSLAEKVIKGDKLLLKQAIELIDCDDKNVRSGIAKIFEMVAEKKPELVKPYLEKLLPGLEAEEPQTRWMVIRTLGLCAQTKPQTALKAIPKAKQYIKDKDSGACLWNRTIFYLGCIGALSEKDAKEVKKILDLAAKIVPKQENAIKNALKKINI